ncbi:MAG: metalloregulator ArsR/SmtB family transcription factor [Chloroflexi bacterium]|nr:MAG: metalloregulator ArsR/SmtB family transcription factor [Chloroflexota bacterium]
MDAARLSAIGERNRLRIVELLNIAPRPVGEIADRLGLRQPQVTKHLQILQRVGLVAVHPLGQRRIYALRREPFAELSRWLDVFAAANPREAVLDEYANAIKVEAAVARKDRDFGRGRVFKFERKLPAPRSEIWALWTTGRLVRRWWSPERFEVVRARVEPVAGGRLEIVMQEGDGTRHASRGRFLDVEPPKHLRFELGPIDPDGRALLTAVYDLTLVSQRGRTNLVLTIRVTSATQAAVPALAGLELGWRQLLDKLERIVGAGSRIGSEPRGTGIRRYQSRRSRATVVS